MSENKTNINWYPGHMAKAKREIKEILKIVDIVIEVVDARVPISSHIKDIDEFVKDKKKIIVFNKYDLCDKEKTNKFINKYESENFNVVLCDSKNGDDYKKVIKCINDLMIKTNQKRKEKGLLAKKAKVLIIGCPNTGKSTLINKIANKKIAVTGNKPGVTKNISMIKINEYADLIDTPGILWPKFDSENIALNLASMSIIKEEIVPSNKVAIYILRKLSENYKDILKNSFGIDEYEEDNIEDIYASISKYKNIKYLNGEVDYDRVSIFILNEIKSEKIKNITFD